MAMDSTNVLLVSGVLDRAPTMRFRDDGNALCTGTLRLDEPGANGTVYKTYVAFEAYSKVAEVVAERQAGDVVLLQGKVMWRKYVTKSGEEKAGLALLVQKCSVLVAAPAGVPA